MQSAHVLLSQERLLLFCLFLFFSFLLSSKTGTAAMIRPKTPSDDLSRELVTGPGTYLGFPQRLGRVVETPESLRKCSVFL